MRYFIILLTMVFLVSCSSFQATRQNVNEAFKAEKQVVQDIKKWADALEKERPTKLGVMNAVKDTFRTSTNYSQTVTMLTKETDKTKEYYKAYDLVLYLKALGYGAKDIIIALVGESIDLVDIITAAVGG